MFFGITDAPFGHPVWQVLSWADTFVDQKLGHIKTDAACADNGNAFTHRSLVAQHVYIVQNVWSVLPLDAGITRHHACCYDYLVITVQIISSDFLTQPGHNPHLRHHCAIPIDEPPEFLFSGNLFGHVELAADLIGPVKKSDFMASLSRCHRGRQSGGTGPDNGNRFLRRGRFNTQFCFIAGAWIDETG